MLRTSLILLTLFLSTNARADPVDEIIRATANARVIFLGEPDHGDGGAMSARAELIDRLHRDHGVRWVMFESSAFDARRADAAIREGGDSIEAVTDGVLDIWSASTELDPVFKLLAETANTDSPLRIAGMDATPVGSEDECLHCTDLRARAGAIDDPELRVAFEEVVDRLEAWWADLDRTKRIERPEALVEAIESVSRQLTEDGHADLAREIRGWAVWIRSVTPQMPLSQELINERDAFMAETLLAFLDRIPRGDRVVVILHDIHGMRRLLPVFDANGEAVDGMPVPAAQIVCDALGDDAFTLGLAAASGTVQATWNPTPRTIELPPDSFERAALADTDAESVFVTCGPNGTAPRGVRPSGMVSFWTVSGDWNAMFDGVWVLRETRPVRRR